MEKIIYEKKNFTIYRSCAIPIIVWPSFVAPFQLPCLRRSNYNQKKKDTVVCPLLRHSNYDRKKKDTVVWPSFVAPFQLPLLRRSNYDRKKYIQSSVHCYAIPITTGKKKIQSSGHHSLRRSNCHCCAVPITTGKKRYSRLSVVTPFQLRPEKKDTVIWPSFVAPIQLPLLCRSNYDRKKKGYNRLSVVTPFQIRPEKKKNVEKIIYEKKNFTIYRSCAVPIIVWPSFVAPFQLPWLRRSNYDRKKKDTVVCPLLCHSNYDRKKKRYSRLAIIRCAIPIAIVAPFQLRPEKKKIQSSVRCYAIPITTGKEKKDTVGHETRSISK
jgi:hypothetical protein